MRCTYNGDCKSIAQYILAHRENYNKKFFICSYHRSIHLMHEKSMGRMGSLSTYMLLPGVHEVPPLELCL